MNDADLVRQSLAGQTDASAELVRRWAPRVVAVCHARVGRAGAADDLAQETLLRGFRALGSLADPARFGAWLVGIALRTCLDWHKAKERTTVAFSALGPDGLPEQLLAGPPDTAADDADERRRLLAEVEALPEAYRKAVMLYYYDDLTYRQLAELLGVSPATVNARLTKARAILREKLDPARSAERGARS